MGTISTDLDIAVEKGIIEKLKEVGIDQKKPFEMLSKLATAQKMTVDKFGTEHWEEDSVVQLKVAEMIFRLTGELERKVEEGLKVVEHRMAPEDIARLERIAMELKGLERRLKVEKVQQGEVVDAAFVEKQ